jgi:hypothetical protein
MPDAGDGRYPILTGAREFSRIRMIPITIEYFVSPGDSGKAEGFADGEWANHRQAALAAATRNLMMCCERTHA